MNRYEQFVMLCEQTCEANEYRIEHRRREHNSAMRALERLKIRLYSEPEHSLPLMSALLQHHSEKVRINASAYCLEANICVDAARNIAADIYRNSTDKILALNAYFTMMLRPRTWK